MNFKAGFVGVVGLPNAGKSTLVNGLIKEKVSIVTSKPQTTRRRGLGIVNTNQSQIVFVDAPGFLGRIEKRHENKGPSKTPQTPDRLHLFIQKETEDIINNSDGLLLVLNIDEKKKERLDELIDLVAFSNKPWAVLISKTDIKKKFHRILMLEEQLKPYNVPIFCFSSKKETSKSYSQILKICEGLIPESPAPLYDVDFYTTDSVRQLASEFIREQCFVYLHDEIPFGLAVVILQFDESQIDESQKGLIKIFAEIWVEKENHMAIVVGQKGATIKKIGSHARKNIEKLVDKKVFIDLKVKFRKWGQNQKLMKELGYVV